MRGVAVSRLSVRIIGEESPAGERVVAELGRALQLTKILHNMAEDARRDRLYLPRELLHAHNMFATTPSWVVARPELRHVCRDLAELAERHYAAAAEAMVACPRWTMRPVAVMLATDRARLHELLARGWRRLDEPAQMPAWRKLGLAVRHGLAALKTAAPRPPAWSGDRRSRICSTLKPRLRRRRIRSSVASSAGPYCR